MQIRWDNIFALVFLIFLFVILMRGWNQIGWFLGNMGTIGSGRPPQEQAIGFVAFGLVLVLIVAIVKILVAGKNH